MPSTTTKIATKTDVALEEQLSAAYKVAVFVITGSGVLALTLFSVIWTLKA